MFDFLECLKKNNELVEIDQYVDPVLEATEIVDRISKNNGKSLLFKNNGTNFPLLMNALGSESRISLALKTAKLDDISKDIAFWMQKISASKDRWVDKIKMIPTLHKISSFMPKKLNKKGICQQVIIKDDPDLNIFPIIKCWPDDGGRFITLPIIHTQDPITGNRNVGMYRMQVFEKNMTAMHWHKHKVSARHFMEYKKMGKLMPLAIALGGDPIYSYVATAPLPDGIDEYILAGFIRKRSVKLVKCITNDMWVPQDADIILEGYVDPNEPYILEGPFGDHTGFYSLEDYYPKFHLTAITHRKKAIYPATIVGIPPQEDAWIGKATERIFLVPMKMTMIPEIIDLCLPIEGVFHNLAIVKIKKSYAGQGIKVMHSLWGAGQMMFTKIMIVVDGDIDIHNTMELTQYIFNNFNPEHDLILSKGPVDVLDHSCSTMSFGGKMGLDATCKMKEERFELPPVDWVEVKKNIKQIAAFSAIKCINFSLLDQGIAMGFVGIQKTKKNHISIIHKQLVKRGLLKGIKFIVYVEPIVDIDDLQDLCWRASNNLDPSRDIYTVKEDKLFPTIGLDGTRKTKALDNFNRKWPNILTSDIKTINKIDEIWENLNLGTMIPSPSRKYLKQKYQGGAVSK